MGLYGGVHNEAFLKLAKEEERRGNNAYNNIIRNDNKAKKLERWQLDGPVAEYKHLGERLFLTLYPLHPI